MKKLLNDPKLYVEQMLDGLAWRTRVFPAPRRQWPRDPAPVARSRARSASSPAAVPGICRSSPATSAGAAGRLRHRQRIRLAHRRADGRGDARGHGGAGVLRLYGNYGGDRMNFDMAGEMWRLEDIAHHDRAG